MTQNPIHLVYCVPSLHRSAGTERVLTAKVNYLAGHGYRITVVTTEQGDRPPHFPLDPRVRLVDFGLHFDRHLHHPFPLKVAGHLRKLTLYRRRLEALLRSDPASYCISLFGKEIDFIYKLRDPSLKVAEIHYARDFRLQFLSARKRGWFWRWLGRYRTRQLERVTRPLHRVVVLTKADLRDWSKTHTNVIQIYNPVPFHNDRTATLDAPIALAVGRLSPQKGFDRLIDCWKLVAAAKPGWKLHIRGEGELENQLRARIEEHQLGAQVLLPGNTDRVQDDYLNSSLLVMSSRYEGFPMVLVEAASFGLPLVAFDCKHGPADIIRDGWNGYLIPGGDIRLMAEKLIALMDTPALRKEMGQHARDTSRLFSLDTIMQQWTTLFSNGR